MASQSHSGTGYDAQELFRRLEVQKRALKACRAINVRLGAKNAALYSACIEAAGLISAGVIGRLIGMKPITEKGEKQINTVMDKLNAAMKK